MENKKINIDEILKRMKYNYGYYYDDKYSNNIDKIKESRKNQLNCSDFDVKTKEELEKARKRVAIMKMIYDEDYEVKKFELDSDDCVLKVEIGLKSISED